MNLTLKSTDCDLFNSTQCNCNKSLVDLVNIFLQKTLNEKCCHLRNNQPRLYYFIGIDPVGFGNTIEWRQRKNTPELFISVFFNESINSYCFKVCVFFAHSIPLREHLIFKEIAKQGHDKCNLSELMRKSHVMNFLNVIHEIYDVKFKIHHQTGLKIYTQLRIEFPHLFKILRLLELTKCTIINNLKKPISQSYRELILPRSLKEYINS